MSGIILGSPLISSHWDTGHTVQLVIHVSDSKLLHYFILGLSAVEMDLSLPSEVRFVCLFVFLLFLLLLLLLL